MPYIPWYIMELERKPKLKVREVDNLLRPLKLPPELTMAVKNWLLERGRMEMGTVRVISQHDLGELRKLKSELVEKTKTEFNIGCKDKKAGQQGL